MIQRGIAMKDINKAALSELKLPEDLKKLSYARCRELCREIRQLLIKTVAENGGHLSSNLGTVELTMAIHRVFSSPEDKIIWDVGHQAYTHKILTGRLSEFRTIRTENGLSGFTRPEESVHDAFISGHSSNSISAALGIARAMKLKGDEHDVIAIVGDGAFTGGMVYEGLNNAGKSNCNLIVILNDNGVSISKNVGAMAKYLSQLRGKKSYQELKKSVEKALDNTPVVGKPIKKLAGISKDVMRWGLYRINGASSGTTMFENMGFVYLGPVDGHNLPELEETLRAARAAKKPVLIHVNTVKGKGYRPAENNPGGFHGISAGAMKKGNPDAVCEDCFSAELGRELTFLAHTDERICAITAAMKYATGLHSFASEYPQRFFDVGIAEQHALTFSAGLAVSGMLPVFAVYSSFMQRCYDQIIHDAAICSTHIVLAVDRAGLVGEDGETHQGIFDVAMLGSIPNVTVYSPSDYAELKLSLNQALYNTVGIAVVRYPKGIESKRSMKLSDNGYCHEKRGSDMLAVSYGRCGAMLAEAGEKCGIDVLKIVKLFPVEKSVIEICKQYSKIIIFEEGIVSGGLGEKLAARLSAEGYPCRVKIIGINGFVKQGKTEDLLAHFGLDEKGMINAIAEYVAN